MPTCPAQMGYGQSTKIPCGGWKGQTGDSEKRGQVGKGTGNYGI